MKTIKKESGVSKKPDMHGFAKLCAKEIMETYNVKAIFNDDEDKNYDIEVVDKRNKENTTMLVNKDCDDNNTGNVCVEVGRVINKREIPVGVMSSPAENYAFKLFGIPGLYIIPTEKLKNMYNEGQHHAVQYTDGDPSVKFAVFRKQLLLDKCNKLDVKL